MKIRKAQNGEVLVLGNPERDEMLTYRTSDGKFVTRSNPKAGYVSGTDPIGSTIVEGLILGKPLASATKWLGNKIIPIVSKAFKRNNYTDNLIKALGDKYKGPQPNDITLLEHRELLSKLKGSGVDVSKFGKSDLNNLQKLRSESLRTNIPDSRYAIVESRYNGNNYGNSIMLKNKNKDLGSLDTFTKNGATHASDVESYMPGIEKHVSEDLYNAGIKVGNAQNRPGLVTGEYLNSPEQTYKIWEKFYNKKLISKDGTHNFNKGDYVRKTGEQVSIDNGPVYKLTTPSRDIPTKSSSAFHPSIVDKQGKFHTDWANPDIYKLLPLGLLYNGRGDN